MRRSIADDERFIIELSLSCLETNGKLTPMKSYAAFYISDQVVVQILLDRGAIINARYGKTQVEICVCTAFV